MTWQAVFQGSRRFGWMYSGPDSQFSILDYQGHPVPSRERAGRVGVNSEFRIEDSHIPSFSSSTIPAVTSDFAMPKAS